ncbi:hypothetical protein [Rhizobium sp. WSM1274]|uniref:hypothetical protein n=1 Tax=Rhizobium sp. WSM1274 TaxID=3138254 RepID=UPI004053F349
MIDHAIRSCEHFRLIGPSSLGDQARVLRVQERQDNLAISVLPDEICAAPRSWTVSEADRFQQVAKDDRFAVGTGEGVLRRAFRSWIKRYGHSLAKVKLPSMAVSRPRRGLL